MEGDETNPKAGSPTSFEQCGICGSAAILDLWLDIHLCPCCGARLTEFGWQAFRIPSK
jgi:hypothetical protein